MAKRFGKKSGWKDIGRDKSDHEDYELSIRTKPTTTTKTSEQKGLIIGRQSIVTNTRHIKPFRVPTGKFFNGDEYCGCCTFGCNTFEIASISLGCGAFSVLLLSMLTFFFAVPLSITYGGYLVVLEGIKAKDHYNSLNIEMECVILNATQYAVESCETKDNDALVCTTTYKSFYEFALLINDSIAGSSCLNESGWSVSDQVVAGKLEYTVGNITTCYTNDDCDEVYWYPDIDYMAKGRATRLFVGAAFVFLFACLCGMGSCLGALRAICEGMCVQLGDRLNKELKKSNFRCCYCHCIKYRNAKKEWRRVYYESHWKNLGKRKQFDYVLGNWTRPYRYGKKMIGNDVIDMIVQYYDREIKSAHAS